MLEEFIKIHLNLIRNTKTGFKRYLYKRINWGDRLIGITGFRGVGKTTLMLQYFMENFENPEDCLYISCDNIKLIGEGLFSSVSTFFDSGGKVIILDEIHKYPNWSMELKNLYDSYPEKKIIFSGSSTLELVKGKYDLSRRAVIYRLAGLSFREYLELFKNVHIKEQQLDNILKSHVKIASNIGKDVSVLRYFRSYLKEGYYPFLIEGSDSYGQKVLNALEKVLYEDIPAVYQIRPSAVPILKKLIFLVGTSQPFVPNIERIGAILNISKEYTYYYIDYLEKAGIFNLLFPDAYGIKLLRRPEKIYLENPNIFYAVSELVGASCSLGAVRECFFVNQLRNDFRISYSKSGDFSVGRKYVFEVGGGGKGFKQITDEKNSYLVCDDILMGYKNKIPLYLFGLLY